MLKKYFLLMLLFTALSIHGTTQTSDADLPQSFAKGDYPTCIKSCDQILQSDAKNKTANFYKGASLIKLKKYEQAKDYLLAAAENNYQPEIAIRANQLRLYAGLQDTASLLPLLQKIADNGFRATSVLEEKEFSFLKGASSFEKLKVQVDKNANPCHYGAEYKRLDFWLGEWEVYVNDTKIGTSSISKSEGACTLYEDYKTFSGFLGRSTNYYDPADKAYTQIWIDKFNSIIIFKEVESREGYLQMSTDKGDGKLTRMTYVKDPDQGNVTQTLEDSTDNGKTWNTSFIGVYKKRDNS